MNKKRTWKSRTSGYFYKGRVYVDGGRFVDEVAEREERLTRARREDLDAVLSAFAFPQYAPY